MKKNICLVIVLLMTANLTFCQLIKTKKDATPNPEPEQVAKNDENDKRLKLVNEAMKYLGTPYKYASTTDKGMDCSGLVYRCTLDTLSISLPRSSSALAAYCTKLEEKAEPQIGDFLFFNTTGKGISHVGIYIGNGEFIHSASQGKVTGVIISNLSEAYWKKCFLFYGTIFN